MILRSTLGALLLVTGTAAAAQYADDRYGYPAGGYQQDYQDRQVRSVDQFYAPLARYGRWVNSRWGRAWSPNVERGWRPYTIGRWDDSGDYGRTWRSDEPFGWATYHYGRWGFDERLGWLWVPDTVWGPGWVAWRDGGDYAGWAPLPPRVSFSFSFGAGAGFNDWSYDRWYQPSWVFVPRDYLYGRSLRGAILPYQRNREWYGQTRGITRYERENGRIVNRSFGFERRGDGSGRDRDDRYRDGRDRDARDRDRRDGRGDYGRPGDDQRSNARDGVRLDNGQLTGGGVDLDRGRRDDATRPGSDRRDAAGGPQRFRDRNRDGVSDSLQRPPVTDDGNRPGGERRRDRPFEPASPAVPPVVDGQPLNPQPLPPQFQQPQFQQPQFQQPQFQQPQFRQPGQRQLPPGEAQSERLQSDRPQFDRGGRGRFERGDGGRFDRGDGPSVPMGDRGLRAGERAGPPAYSAPAFAAPAVVAPSFVAPSFAAPSFAAPPPVASPPAAMPPAPVMAAPAAPSPPAVERPRGEGDRGGQRGDRSPQQLPD